MIDFAIRLRDQLRNQDIGCDSLALAVEDVLGLHVIGARYAAVAGLDICQECGKHWPCPTARSIAEALDVSLPRPADDRDPGRRFCPERPAVSA